MMNLTGIKDKFSSLVSNLDRAGGDGIAPNERGLFSLSDDNPVITGMKDISQNIKGAAEALPRNFSVKTEHNVNANVESEGLKMVGIGLLLFLAAKFFKLI